MDQLKIIYGLDTDFMHKSTTNLTVLPKKKLVQGHCTHLTQMHSVGERLETQVCK